MIVGIMRPLASGAEGEAVELGGFPFNKRGFVGPILIQREPVPPRDFLLVVLGEPHAHDELVVVQVDLVHEILEDLVSNLRVVHVGMQELVEVRLDAVPVLAQRHADVFRPYGIVQGALLLFELRETLCHRIADHAPLDDLHEVREALLHFPALRLQRLEIRGVVVALLVILRRIQGERRHVLLVVDDVVQGEQHHVLQVLFAGLVQVALFPALGGAIVVVIRPPGLART